ncbi:MAG: type I-E CRISPR-associated protein Cas6/Cse3/CasE [Deltaproteobacteria bacterium]|nr:type I-E CRISPR-associated protein Cas6/Cse3/CasE [Deltaproteobacteria bacterium]
MFMVELPLDALKLIRCAKSFGHESDHDEDFGYAVHAWLSAALGDLAPKPFRVFEGKNGLRLLGYCPHDIRTLHEYACSFADPTVLEACDWAIAAGKAMPVKWIVGRRLGFEVRVCPISRGDCERDVFLAALDRARKNGEPLPGRVEVYLSWLIHRMKAATKPNGGYINLDGSILPPTVELWPDGVFLTGFRRIKCKRQFHPKRTGQIRKIERPDALFRGDLTVRDPETFAAMLAHGIGRHRAFGFGMMLLRPPGA